MVSLASCSRSTMSNTLSSKYRNEDVSARLQYMVNAMGEGDTLKIDQGEYLLSKVIQISGRSNLTIIANNATLRTMDGAPVNKAHSILSIYNSKNISIEGLTCDGNRDTRIPKETFAHAVMIIDSDDITFDHMSVINSVVDGYYVASSKPDDLSYISKRINFIECNAIGSYRNGLSIINGHDIMVDGGSYSESKGTSPQAGIDVEANANSYIPGSRNIVFKNVHLEDNSGWGILVSQKGSPENINIEECIFQNNLGGIKHTGSKSIINNNDLMNCDFGIESIRYAGYNEDHNILVGNTIEDCVVGIKYSGYGGLIEGNTISNCSEKGIHLNGNTKDYTQVIISKNVLDNAGLESIYAFNFKEANVIGNTIKNSKGLGVYMAYGKLLIEDNVFENLVHGINLIGSNTQVESNTFIEIKNRIAEFTERKGHPSSGRFDKNTIISSSKISDDQVVIAAKKVVLGNNLKKKR